MNQPKIGEWQDVRSIAVDTLTAAAVMAALYFACDALAQLLLQQ